MNMKKIVLMIAACLLSMSVHALDNIKLIDTLKIVKIGHLNDNKVTIYLSQLSPENCKIVMRTRFGSDLAPFLDRVNITGISLASKTPSTPLPGVRVFKFENVAERGLIIETKDGRSFGDNRIDTMPYEEIG